MGQTCNCIVPPKFLLNLLVHRPDMLLYSQVPSKFLHNMLVYRPDMLLQSPTQHSHTVYYFIGQTCNCRVPPKFLHNLLAYVPDKWLRSHPTFTHDFFNSVQAVRISWLQDAEFQYKVSTDHVQAYTVRYYMVNSGISTACTYSNNPFYLLADLFI